MERVINIIGMGESGKDAPDTGENWVINIAWKRLKDKKVDKMFFMDNLFEEVLAQDKMLDPIDYNFNDFLKCNPDVELISKFNSIIKDKDMNPIKTIKEYPLNKAIEISKGGYFTSSVAYALAYAILEKVDRIRLYGFELWTYSCANEYEYERPCVEFWIAFALARGIKVEIPYMILLNSQNKQNYYGWKPGELFQNYRRNYGI